MIKNIFFVKYFYYTYSYDIILTWLHSHDIIFDKLFDLLLYQYGGVLMHSVVNLIVLDQILFTVDLEMKIQTHVDFWSGAMPILNSHFEKLFV